MNSVWLELCLGWALFWLGVLAAAAAARLLFPIPKE